MLQTQQTVALLSKLTHDVTRDTTITLDETVAIASYARTRLEQWLDAAYGNMRWVELQTAIH